MIPPLYWHVGDPTPPEPPVMAKASRSVLSGALALAIHDRDVDQARDVMDRAFWSGVGFHPDWFHLFLAFWNEDRKMARFLLSHGAEMSPVHLTVCMRALPDKIDRIIPLLAAHGIRPLPAGEEPEGLDTVAIVSRLNAEALHFSNDEQKKKSAQALKDSATKAFINYVESGDIPKALQVMRLTGQDPSRGLDINHPVACLLRDNLMNRQRALDFIRKLLDHGDQVKLNPLDLAVTDCIFLPGLVLELHKHGLLGEGTYADRVRFLSVRPLAALRGFGSENDAVTKILFDASHPATEKEVDHFLQFHKIILSLNVNPLLQDLSTLGFFDSPAWTPEKLIALKKQHHAPSDILDKFNKSARRRLIDTHGLESFLNAPQIQSLVEAHRVGAFHADAGATLKILDCLHEIMKLTNIIDMNSMNRVAPRDFVLPLVAVLKESRADFSAVDPMKYLDKTGPGLAKILLDLDIVKAESFDLRAIKKRNGGKMEIITPPSEKTYPYTEFMAQIILEASNPRKYIPLRHKTAVSWQEELKAMLLADDAPEDKLSLTFPRKSQGPKP